MWSVFECNVVANNWSGALLTKMYHFLRMALVHSTGLHWSFLCRVISTCFYGVLQIPAASELLWFLSILKFGLLAFPQVCFPVYLPFCLS